MRGRCAICRCKAVTRAYGFKVCRYHETHGESDPPCPYCFRYRLFDPRWTYTVTGELRKRNVQVRQVTLPKTVFLDANGETVLCVETVREHAPTGYPTKMRQSVVVVGVGLQMGENFTITQWATDWENHLFETITPMLSLTPKIYMHGLRGAVVLAGGRLNPEDTPWPTLDIRHKVINVVPFLDDQKIPPSDRAGDISPEQVHGLWSTRSDINREKVFRHNYLNVLDLSMRVFQIEWPITEEEA